MLCHSPLDVSGGGLKVAEGKAFAGRPFAPDGVPFATAPNLTPDRETGIGTWSDDMLARAIREGISHDGRAMFPVMPYQKFRRMSDEDLAALVVYLRSLPPIRNPMAADEDSVSVEPADQRRARAGGRPGRGGLVERGETRRIPGQDCDLRRLPLAPATIRAMRPEAWTSPAAR